VLAKINNTDFNTQWVAPGGGSGDVATDTIWDAVGDLVVGTGANTGARLAVGANNKVLTVVGGTPAWADPPGGGGGDGYPQQLGYAGI
jgi:hypothetical protein